MTLANKGDSLPLRVSYKLGLRGPSLNRPLRCSDPYSAERQGRRAPAAALALSAGSGGAAETLARRVDLDRYFADLSR